jgi:hypothetical protein
MFEYYEAEKVYINSMVILKDRFLSSCLSFVRTFVLAIFGCMFPHAQSLLFSRLPLTSPTPS